MPIVADAAVAIRGDMSGFHRDLAGAQTATTTLGGKLREIFSVRNLALGAGILGVGVGLRNLVGYAGDAAAAYSDLEQSTKTVDELFGESAGVIEDWGERAATAAGLTKNQVNESASVIGQTLLNVGYDAETASGMVLTLQQRAADLALAFNEPTSKAVLGIGALLRGEYDTIEKFGVIIKESDVQARILALGLDTSTDAAKRNAKAVAALNLLLEQTATVSGRYADSQDDVAVKVQNAQAKIDNFMAESFGPMVTSIQLGAITVGEGVVGVAEGVGMFFDNVFSPEKQAQVQGFADAAGVTFNQMRDHIDRNAAAFGRTWEEELARMVENQEKWAEGSVNATTEWAAGITAGLEEGAGTIRVAVEDIADIPLEEMEERYEAIRNAGYQTVLEYAKGLLTPQTDVETAIQTALQVVEDEMSITEELAYLSGQKTVLEEARGIASQEGKDASVLAIDAALAEIETRMAALANRAYDYGFNTVGSYAAGIVNNLGVMHDASRQLATKFSSQARIESEPPDHTSPLYGITKWGGNIVKTIAGGITSELGTASAASGALAGALVPSVGGFAMAGVPLPMGTGGNTYVMNVNGVQREYDNAQAALEALIEMGAFTEGRLS